MARHFFLENVERYRGRFCWIWQSFKSLLIPLDSKKNKYLESQDLGFRSWLDTIDPGNPGGVLKMGLKKNLFFKVSSQDPSAPSEVTGHPRLLNFLFQPMWDWRLAI